MICQKMRNSPAPSTLRRVRKLPWQPDKELAQHEDVEGIAKERREDQRRVGAEQTHERNRIKVGINVTIDGIIIVEDGEHE